VTRATGQLTKLVAFVAITLVPLRLAADPGKATPTQDPSASATASPSQQRSTSAPPELVEKRGQRIKQQALLRQRNREQRRADLRRDLERRMAQRLGDRPITLTIRAELESHARRVARLRRARVVAAEHNDWRAVEQADRLLAREHARHERWWRTSPELSPNAATTTAPSASATPTSSPKEPR
jgi:hypothetical protein